MSAFWDLWWLVHAQHIAADAQIELKQNVLKSHLQHFAGIQPDQWLPPLRSQREDYRRKARIGGALSTFQGSAGGGFS